MPLTKRKVTVPLAAGLQTKADPRALQPPGLTVCKNIEFEEVGGLQKRKPYVSIGVNILGGGTLSNVRRFYANGDELICFTSEALYSWSARDTAWVLKATWLAAKVTEQSSFVDPTEQVSTDRCEVGNCVIFAWVKNHGTATSRTVWVAAKDKTTGATILPATQPSSGGVTGVDRPRLVALASKALLFFVNSDDDLVVIGLTPATLAADLAVAGTLILDTADHSDYYDAVSDGTAAYFAVRRNPNTSYEVGTVSSAVAVTKATIARACSGPISLAVSPGGASRLLVARDNSGTLRGDILNQSTFAEVTANVSLGTTSTAFVQVTACYRTVQVGGQWNCYVFVGELEDEGGNSGNLFRVATLNNAGTAVTLANLATNLSLASRAFDHNGRVYVNTVFAIDAVVGGVTASADFRSAPQNTYFLHRDDGFLVAKMATHVAAGHRSVTSHLPGVQSLGSNVYAWCGGERRSIPINTRQSDYSARAPRDIQITFDSNDARRCARLGQTLYITGGEVMQYDGTSLVECGWHLFPWKFFFFVAGAGTMTAGTYTWGSTWRSDNAVGDRDRSTMVSTDSATLAINEEAQILVDPVAAATHRTKYCQEIWRTPADPVAGAPRYLVTGQDPTVITGDNAFIPGGNSPGSFVDSYADTVLTTKEAFDENDGVLERLAPPPASIIVATQSRIILAGISDNPYRIVYSRLRGEGEVAAFHDALTVDVPPTGGAITALGFLNETLVAFCETAVWALPGDGFDNTGGGQNYGPARLLSSDVGAVNAEAVALTPKGLLFKSSKGWYLLSSGWQVQYIGSAVASFDSDTICAVHVMESKHQVRCMGASSRALVWDYLVNEWSEWTITDGIHAGLWNSTYHYATSSAVKAEQSSYSTADYFFDVETAWIPVDGFLGRGRIWYIAPVGEYRSAFDLRIRIARNYDDSDASGPTWVDDKFWSPSPTTVGGPLRVRHGLASPQRCHAIKVRLTDYADGSTTNPPAGEALKLTALEIEMGVEPGLYKGLAAAQKQ